ncbi:MAG TPA: hypothetical protein VFT72_07850 [Opitutaceae bacterium]|nr:hypothetical protein [Opitutaceae bacterium]
MTAPAVFLGVQPGFRHIPAIELYNLVERVGIHPAGSTVSRQTLVQHGFDVPARRRRASRRIPQSV